MYSSSYLEWDDFLDYDFLHDADGLISNLTKAQETDLPNI